VCHGSSGRLVDKIAIAEALDRKRRIDAMRLVFCD
jgi:hypothetical protein